MSDVTVTVVESNTNVTVTEQDVAVAITETPVTVTTSTAGIQGATGATGAGYSGVTSTSTITIGSGLKTFTLVSGNQGAFVTGMRIRAIHSDTPTYYMEGTANYVGAGTLIITVDKFNGSGSHNLWQFAISGEVGQTGATGSSGVVSVTSPITNTGTSGSAIVGIDQTLLSLTRSQISDFTSGTVTFATTSGTAVYATTSGTATYATLSGTAVNISGTVAQSQVTSLTTDLANRAKLDTANTFTVGGHVITNAATAVKGLVIKGASGQSANLLELQTSDGVLQTAFSPIGYAQIGAGTNPGGQLGIPLGAAANRGIVIRGAASQSADLQQWQTSSGGTAARIKFDGTPTFSYGTFFGQQTLSADADAVKPLVVKGFSATQSANLQEWQNSGGTVLSRITSLGSFAVPASGSFISGTTGHANIITNDAATTPLLVKGAASQSANLQSWQNSGGTTIASVDSAGNVRGLSVRSNSDYTSLLEANSGGYLRLTRQTAATPNPGANLGSLYFRDGTTGGTLKLVVRAGAAGAETTILDNIPQ